MAKHQVLSELIDQINSN